MNLLGKMANLMSSLLPRSTPAMPKSNDGKADEMKLLVVDYRTHLTNAIYQGEDCVEVIKRLAELDCPLCDKYAVLQVIELLTFNNQSLKELKRILAGLAAIVKYAQHLIRKSEDRRDQWRIIHFSNAVVQKKIRPMKGFEMVLQQLGYTIVSPNGLCFPVGVEPNFVVIINLIADMMLFRKEIKEYMLGSHLHPQYLEQYIPLDTKQEVQTAQFGRRDEDEDFVDVSSTPTTLMAPEGQLRDKPTEGTGQHSNLNASLSVTSDSQQVSQPERTQTECNNNRQQPERTQPECNNNRQQPERTQPERNNDKQQPETTQPERNNDRQQPERTQPERNNDRQQPERTQPERNNDRQQPERTQPECNNNSVANEKFQVAIPISKNTTDMSLSTSVDEAVAIETSSVSNLKEPECLTEQLQSTCDPVQAIQDLVTPSNEQDTVVTESSSGTNSSLRLACTVCGDEAIVYCEECTKKPLCQSCNTNWHKHPQRQGHNQKCISVLDFASPEHANALNFDGAYGISAQTNTDLDRVSQKQQTHLVKQKRLNNTTSVNYKQYSPELAKRFPEEVEMNAMAFCLPNQRQNEQSQLSDYNKHQNMCSHQQHYPQPLHYPHLTNPGFDSHQAPYQSQGPYNNTRLVYPGQGQGYLHSQMNPGHFMPVMESFNARMPQKQLFGSSELMNSYHPEVGVQQPHTLPFLQHQLSDPQRQATLLPLQQSPGWHNPGMVSRTHNLYPYNQDLAHPQHVDDFGHHSYVPTSIMPGSMFHHTNPSAVHQSTNQMFPVNPQHVIRSNGGQFTRNNQLVNHQGTLLPGKIDVQMNKQGAYNQGAYNLTSTGHIYHHTTLDVHQMGMPGLYGGNQDSMNSPNHYQVLPMTKPAYQTMQQHLVSSTSSSSLSSILSPILDQLKQLPNIEMQRAKCDAYIARLVRDITDIEQQINSAMEADVEVYETEQFRIWNKQKTLLIHQKKHLENYKYQLENETALMKMNFDEEIPQQIHYPPAIDLSVRTSNTNRPVPISSSEKMPNVAISAEHVTMSDVLANRPTISNTNNSAAVTNVSPAMLKQSHSSSKTEDAPNSAIANISQLPKVQSSPPPLPQRIPREVDILSRTFPPPKIINWSCQHCTYLNPTGANICQICCNPIFVGKSHVDSSNDDNNVNEFQENLIRRDRFLDLLEDIHSERQKEKAEKFKEDNSTEHKDNSEQTRLIGSRICGSQEQMLTEKKRAQQEFIHKQQEITSKTKPVAMLHSSAPVKIKSLSPVSSSASSPYDREQNHQLPCNHNQELEINEHYSPGSSDYHTPPSASPSPPSPHRSASNQQHITVNASIHNEAMDNSMKFSLGNCDSSIEDTLARLNELSVIESMQVQGAEFTKLIKMADREGFNVEAVQIAQSYSDIQNGSPIEWLKQNWTKNVNMVATMVVASGNNQQQNTVGELSVQEAESAYISCHGSMKDAIHLCVRKRTELYEQLGALGDYPREEILQVMFQCCGDREAAEKLLVESTLRPFLKNIWAEKETDNRNRFAFDLSGALPEMCHSFSTSIIFHGDFQKIVKDKSLDRDRRIRMIFVEGKLKSWGRAELVIKILDDDLPDEDVSLEDVVEAVRNCRDRSSALAYLQQECELCFTNFPMSKIRSLNFCQCKMCEQCLTKNFEIGIREKHVRHWTCPLCSQPDMNDSDVASDYLQFLLLLLQPLIDKDLQNLFETKVRDWHLQKDVSFRWCAHCAEGFLAAENQGELLRMTCPHCQKKTCFQCKKQWEPQHEGLACEEFAQWKIDNDPSNQSVGLAKHLDENGIDCPTCKMRFALAKGGCMHFKCPQCGHEFCSGCYEPFHQKEVCMKYKICKKLGLHCHCPRDCFSYLRDRTVQQLQEILKAGDVYFNVDIPEDQTDTNHCPVMEQKEFDAGKKDEKCGKETLSGQAGLCEIHYKEYLVYIINRHELDPVILMTMQEMVNFLYKYDIQAPKQTPKETPEEYLSHLIKVIQENLPLRR